MSYFSTRSSTQEEIDRFNDLEFGELQDKLVDKIFYELTAASPECDPLSKDFALRDEHMVESDGRMTGATQPIALFVLEVCICGAHKDKESSFRSRTLRRLKCSGFEHRGSQGGGMPSY